MSRTDLDSHTLARSLRRMAGDGSVEWVMEPIQADVLRDIADMLDENAKLRELIDACMGCGTRYHTMQGACPMFDANAKDCCKAEEIARELRVEVSNA